ncbi:MAG: hypothetical protein OER86_04080 [Phycisphaerae bacterium]|nr:hypothetical protein [Phycisphaerae bacterium]
MSVSSLRCCLVGGIVSCLGAGVLVAADPEPVDPFVLPSLSPRPDTPAEVAPAPVAPAAEAPLSDDQEKFWKLNWKHIARSYALAGDRYFAAPRWDRRYPSSSGKTLDQWTREHTKSERVQVFGGIFKTVKHVPIREEAFAAASTLPDVASGQYGYIHSAKVLAVRGPEEMWVGDIWLVDQAKIKAQRESDERAGERLYEKLRREAEARRERERRLDRSRSGDRNRDYDRRDNDKSKTTISRQQIQKQIDDRYKYREEAIKRQGSMRVAKVRVVGFPTGGLQPGQRWNGNSRVGAQLVMVGAGSKGSSGLTAVNADRFHRMMTEDDFKRLLRERGVERVDFVAMLRERMRQSGTDAFPLMVGELERAGAEVAATKAAEARKTTGDSKGSSWLSEKYGKKKDEAGAADKGSAEPAKKKSWLEEKYGKKKDEGAEKAGTTEKRKPSLLDKYRKAAEDKAATSKS